MFTALLIFVPDLIRFASCRPHGDPHMIKFGAHVVLVLRHLFTDEINDSFSEKLSNVGDLILHM